MNLQNIFKICIEEGIKADPRDKSRIQKILKKRNEAYKKTDKEEKAYFDKELLWNPYDDSRILNDDGKQT